MAGRLIANGSASSSTVASPSANRRTIERRVGSDKAAKTTSNRSGAVTVIAVAPAYISQIGYLTESLHVVKAPGSVDQVTLATAWVVHVTCSARDIAVASVYARSNSARSSYDRRTAKNRSGGDGT